MRGKLRDKNSINRRDTFRRGAEGEVRRPYKRDTRVAHWIDQNLEDEYYEDEVELEDDEEEAGMARLDINIKKPTTRK
ncbi:hypothetical protein [Dictyobacter aurantiacus]|uniref:Uncharacterized protein n=1 Tax=Dictyobacter aurantiacus TaxID=1936993 RepID=A0A401ZHR5_9CHLR|nr:hypothetical protein [Dictyobacter aurantiacus]GCE06409.1 hypothetical protein KDAU_37380 [Dictyobacter aurantiacus]